MGDAILFSKFFMDLKKKNYFMLQTMNFHKEKSKFITQMLAIVE